MHWIAAAFLLMAPQSSATVFQQVSYTGSNSPVCKPGPFAENVDCGGTLSIVTPGTGAPTPVAATPGAPATTIPAANIISVPSLATNPTGQPCVNFNTVTGPNLANSPAQNSAEQLGVNLVGQYGLCPNAAVPPALALNPAVLAAQFWQTIPLPVPKPSIPPGYALTGKLAYLVTAGTVSPPAYREQTPLGPLQIVARGDYTVSWGDGATSGPYRIEGLAYPNGVITHTYEDVGSYTVAVHETWSATWTLGGAGGTLEQLGTDGTIPVLPARQVQAVITNG